MIELIVVVVILGLLAAIAAVSYRAVVDNSQRAALRHTGLQFEKETRALAAFGQDAPARHSTEVAADLSSGWTITQDTTDVRKVLLKRVSDGAWVCVYLSTSYTTAGQVAGIGLPGDTSVTSASGCAKPADAPSDTGGSYTVGPETTTAMPGNFFAAGTATAASGTEPGHPASGAVDGDLGVGYWGAGATTAWLEIVPPTPLTLSTVYIDTGATPAQTTHWTIDGFVNGAWASIASYDIAESIGTIYALPVTAGTYSALRLTGSGPSSTIYVGEVTTDGVPGSAANPVGTYANVVMASGPTAYWHLGDAVSGTVNPTSGTWAGTATGFSLDNSLVTGAADGSASFTASSRLSTSHDVTNISSYSAEAWVTTTATSATALVTDRGAPPTPGQAITLGIGEAGGGCGPGRPFVGLDADYILIGVCAPAAVNDGNRHYVVGSWSGTPGQAITCTQFTLYVDGVKVGSPSCLSANYTSPTVTPTAPISGAGGLLFGYHPAWKNAFVGTLDEVAIYAGKTLSGADVTSHWNAGG